MVPGTAGAARLFRWRSRDTGYPVTQMTVPQKYRQFKADADLVYAALCDVLSDRVAQVDWSRFTQLDWQLLGEVALLEGVAPLVYW